MTDPSTPEGRTELRELAGRARKATFEPGWPYAGTGIWTANVNALLGGIAGEFAGAMSPDAVCALLDALDDADHEIERRRGDLVIERRRGNAAEAALAEAQEIIRGHEGAVEGLSNTIGEHRAQVESIREYAQHLHELADAHRDTSTGYLAHVYAEIAVALERKIGDTFGGREVRGVVSVPVVPAVRCPSPAAAADPGGDSTVGAAAESGLDAS